METDRHQEAAGTGSKPESGQAAVKRSARGRVWGRVGLILLTLVVLGGIGRAALPSAVRHHVNRTLDLSPLYAGRVGDVRIHLWRGAYSIRDVHLNKLIGNVPVPLFAASQVDFSLEWDALLNGELVGQVRMKEPELNFVDAPGAEESQSGAGGPWLEMIRDLFPFTINSAVIENGSIHFRVYQEDAVVNVYLAQVDGSIGNLTNIRDDTNPLIATVQATGLVMDQARFEFKMVLDPFSYRPTFQLASRFLDLDVTELNALARAYGSFDFERGWFDLVVEAEAREGQIQGYVKPLFRNLKVSGFVDGLQEEGILQAFWQALIGTVTDVFKHRPRDQFGTLIPFSGDLSGATTADILATVANVLRNAFIRAYLPRLERDYDAVGFLQFEPPDFSEVLSVGDAS